MPEKEYTAEKILDLLGEQPKRIGALTADMTPAQLRQRPEADAWSAVDVLAHLRSCADVWGGCIETILTEDEPTIRAVNPRTWIKQTNYPQLEFHPSFEAFIRQRAALLGRLQTVDAEAWHRGATVTGAGAPLNRTVRFYAQWLATHERSHLKQFKQLAHAMA
ncbi:MAG: DinB family protein [Ardenticatenaceae bacterium]|nr:DinB family protein [Ardenticatenaceae bacterium]